MGLQDFDTVFRFAQEWLEADPVRFRGGVLDIQAVLRDAVNAGLSVDDGNMFETLKAELSDVMMCQQRAIQNEVAPPPRPGTVRWCVLHQDSPVSGAGSMTLRQACYALAWLKQRSRMNGVGLDTLCGLLSAGGLLAQDNLMPRCARRT